MDDFLFTVSLVSFFAGFLGVLDSSFGVDKRKVITGVLAGYSDMNSENELIRISFVACSLDFGEAGAVRIGLRSYLLPNLAVR
jgi:hypothetical protein